MDKVYALGLVYDLAKESALTFDDCDCDPSLLQKAAEQNRAMNIVNGLMDDLLDDRKDIACEDPRV